jgi:hypothetical protein
VSFLHGIGHEPLKLQLAILGRFSGLRAKAGCLYPSRKTGVCIPGGGRHGTPSVFSGSLRLNPRTEDFVASGVKGHNEHRSKDRDRASSTV